MTAAIIPIHRDLDAAIDLANHIGPGSLAQAHTAIAMLRRAGSDLERWALLMRWIGDARPRFPMDPSECQAFLAKHRLIRAVCRQCGAECEDPRETYLVERRDDGWVSLCCARCVRERGAR